MLASAIPTSFPLTFGASAGAGFIHPIPTASQISITPGAASLTDGFPPLNFLPVSAGGVPPFGKDMNGILKAITQAVQWQQAGGLPIYNSTFSTAIGGYPHGAVLIKASGVGFWCSTADNNTSNPDTGGANWITAIDSPSLLSANGWKKYSDPNSPTGYFIEQWGSVIATTLNTIQTINLPIAFPNEILFALASGGGLDQYAYVAVSSLSTLMGACNQTGGGIIYIAKGY
jgi:hypothetical protein